MIFDQLCGIAERHLPQLRPLLEKTRLFQFPGRPHEILPRGRDAFGPEEIEAFQQMFFLPYPVCAIEDPASCIILEDTIPDQMGLSQDRKYLECMPFNDNPEDFQDPEHITEQYRETMAKVNKLIPSGACAITTGRIRLSHISIEEGTGDPIAHYAGTLESVCLAGKIEGIIMPPQDPAKDPIGHWNSLGIGNAKTAIEEVAYFNRPDRFVIERVSLGAKNRGSGKKIPRSDSRPIYTALTVKEIREQLIASGEGTGGKKAPHERRRHFRTFRSERYKAMKGRTIVIPATWIGPSEVTKGRHHYRICLDV